jgi:hypothetical protein
MISTSNRLACGEPAGRPVMGLIGHGVTGPVAGLWRRAAACWRPFPGTPGSLAGAIRARFLALDLPSILGVNPLNWKRMTFNDGPAWINDGSYRQKTDEELRQAIRCIAAAPMQGPSVDGWLKRAAEFLSQELESRQKLAFHQEQLKKQEALHGELKSSVEEVKNEVAKPEKPHWTLTPNFWVSVAVLAVSVVSLVIIILSWRYPVESANPAERRVILMTNFVSIPTNLPPAKPAIQATSSPDRVSGAK